MTSALIPLTGLYHTGIVVDDVDTAMAEYRDLMGVSFGPEGERHVPVWMPEGPQTLSFRFAYTAEGPHHLELVRRIPGTLWTVPGPGHAHHLGYWCADVPATAAELVRRGLPILAKVGVDEEDADSPIVLLRAPSGICIELVAAALRAEMFPDDN